MFFKDLRKLTSLGIQNPFQRTSSFTVSKESSQTSNGSKIFRSNPTEPILKPESGEAFQSNLPCPDVALESFKTFLQSKYNLSFFNSTPKENLKIFSSSFWLECKNQGLTDEEAGSLSRSLKILNISLPEDLKNLDLKSIRSDQKDFSKDNKKLYLDLLRTELALLEKELNPLKTLHNSIKGRAELFVDNAYRFGIGLSVSQCFLTYFGIFYYYGVLVMDPSLFVLGTGGFAASGIIFDKSFIGMYIKRRLFAYKFKKIIRNESSPIESIPKLQEEIDWIRNELLELN